MNPPFLLFDDARDGGAAPRLYRKPRRIIRADRIEEVRPALAALREAVAKGAHAAGYLAYEAGYALDPKLAPASRAGDGPLLWFGLFNAFERPDLDALLRNPGAANAGRPQPRIEYRDYRAAALHVREHLYAGDFYQANLTFGCDVAVSGAPLALYACLRARSRAGWGGVVDIGER